MNETFEFRPVGVVHSPFKEKFGIPRQSRLVNAATGWLEMLPPYDVPEAMDGLEGFSHLWLSFVFHQAQREEWQPRVRPPRLGGNQRMGVFATRSPFRPNPIGLSLVELLGVETGGGVRLRLGGLDLLDGTPVLDIKPYVPYSDAIPDARAGFVPDAPQPVLEVRFAPAAEAALAARADAEHLRELIRQVLALDPRPAYHGKDGGERLYGVHLQDLDVRWRVSAGVAEVLELLAVAD